MKETLSIVLGAILSMASVAHAADTNCEATKVDQVFASEYSRATHAWCQDNSKATYMLASLLRAIPEGKAQFHEGSIDLSEMSGFTAIALGGFKLDAGMIHRREGKKYISVRFTGTDVTSTSVQFYRATYRVNDSVFVDAVQKN